MNNIESIREDYCIGDPIRIVCSLGIKEGYIMDFKEDRIKIRPFEEGRKPISISEENIKDFEEGIPPIGISSPSVVSASNQNSSSDETLQSPEVKGPEKKDESQNTQPSFIKGFVDLDKADPKHGIRDAVHVDEKKSSIIQKENQPTFVKGYVDIKAIDPKGGVRKAVHKNNPWTLALQDQPTIECDKAIERSAKSFASEEDNNVCVYASGFVTDDLKDYGWIWDQNLESKIWFSTDDICDDQLYDMEDLVGVHVSYIKINGPKGPKAIGICLPRPICQILALADQLVDDVKTKQSAYDLLEVIISCYPTNEDAIYLQSQIKTNITKRTKHSVTEPLNLKDIEEIATSGEDKVKEHNESSKANKEKAEKANVEYKKAKDLINEKKHEEALSHYLEAFKCQKSITLVKDISSLYCSLCGKKYIQGHPERIKQAEMYREAGKKFLSDYAYLLPKDQSSYNSLESSYYVLQEYEKFLGVIDKIIRVKVPSQKVLFLNKKAIALLALGRKEDALSVLEQVLKIDSQNVNAKKIHEQIISNVDVKTLLADIFEASDNPISPYLQDKINQYKDFFGVENYILGDETRLYSESTYKKIVNHIENDPGINSDSLRRSQYLLTKIKISMRLNDGAFDKRDFALYCNDMARVTMLQDPNNIQWDVVRFYFNESFSLAASWSAVRRQFVQYIETYIPHRRDDIFGKLPEQNINERLKEDLKELILHVNDKNDYHWDEILLQPSIYNEDICNKIVEEIYNEPQLRRIAIDRFVELSRTGVTESISLESFGQVWRELRDEYYAAQKSLNNSYLSRISYATLSKINSSTVSLKNESENITIFDKDKERINEVFKQLIPKIDAFISAQGYISKQDNYGDAKRMILILKDAISRYPTKVSYESLLPLINRYYDLLEEAWQNIVITSKPKVTVDLQGDSVLIDRNNVVSFQVALSNDKDSSPISRISMSIVNSDDVSYINNEENTHTDIVRGGDKPVIFHMKVKVSEQAVKEKTATITVSCTYENSNNIDETITNDLALRFYSENEYKDFVNPYNAGDAVTNPRMFFGRDTDIENYVNVMLSSPSKQLIFYGQKRSGKSSVLYWLQNKLTENGAFCSRFSMGDLVADLREVTFYYQILYQIQEDLEDYDGEVPIFELPQSISSFESENPTNPMLTFKKYMKSFKQACKATAGWEDKLIVIMIDEFTYIYSYIKQGRIDDSIMKQWKSIIQDPKSTFSAVLVGQDVVPYFENEPYAKNAFQIIEKKRLTYLKETDALKLIIEPIRDENGDSRYASGAAELILNYTACNPYYIQMLCGSLVDYMHEKKAIIATTADVSEVADRLVQTMSDSEFDNLISGGDSLEFGEIKDTKILAVLYRIAKLTETTEYCTRHDIVNYYKEELLDGEENVVVDILRNLEMREVIEINEGMYRIQVKLFQKWILKKKTPETASLKELEK
ncbi:hypothetical protein [Prevotella pectinovora]|uniref:hypothetical protein n=1 Tax=Prevotella pectinovora TaxID=1602169 RepID=UPI00352037A8